MEPNPITLAIVIPLLMGLGLLCLIRRHRQKFEQEKEWEKEQNKNLGEQVEQIICDKQLNKQQGEIIAKFNDIKK